MKAVALVLLGLVALASCQDDGTECDCGMFMTYYPDEIQVHRLPPIDIDNCAAVTRCKNMCAEEYRVFTNNGDLDHQLSSGYSVGQEICILLASKDITHVEYETVYGYARQCGGPWDYDGESSFNKLCCTHGHYTSCA